MGETVATRHPKPAAKAKRGHPAPGRRGRPAWAKLVAIALGVAALTALWRFTPLGQSISAERVLDWARMFGSSPWAAIVLVAAYTPACLVMFPRPLLTLFAVVAFGPVTGFVLAMTGILLAALATYGIGRLLPPQTVRRLAGSRLDGVVDVLRRRGLAASFAVRVVPVAPFAIEGFVAGEIGIRLWHFLLGTFLGMLPGTLATTVFGDQIERALEDPQAINWWLVAAVGAAFVILIVVVRRWFGRQNAAAAGVRA